MCFTTCSEFSKPTTAEVLQRVQSGVASASNRFLPGHGTPQTWFGMWIGAGKTYGLIC